MSLVLPTAVPGTHPVPRATLITEAIVAGLASCLAGAGVFDGAIPALIRVEIIPVSSLVLAVLALAHHSTLQAAQAAAAAACQVGQVLTTEAAHDPGVPAWIPTAGSDVARVMAGIGAAIEAGRSGVVATADSGRHLAPSPADALTEPFSPYPPAVPGVPSPIGA